MNTSRKGLAMVLISSFVFGTIPSTVTFCYSQGATSTLILAVRYFILALLLLPAVLRDRERCMVLFKLGWKKLLCMSLFCTITPIFLFQSYKHLSTSSATALHFMYPTFVMLICVLVFRDKISRIKLLCIVLCFGGIALMLDPSVGEFSLFGAVLALISGCTWACYIISVDKFDLGGMSGSQMMFFIEVFNFVLIVLLYGLPTGTLKADVTPLGWAAVIVSNAIISVFGTLFFTIGVKYTDAQVSSIASTFEPITSILVGVLLLGEPFAPKTAIGTVMILTAVVLLSVFGNGETASAETEKTA